MIAGRFVSALAQTVAPARGAPLADVVWASLLAAVAALVVAVGGAVHRRRGIPILGRLAAFSESVSGLPAWAALPIGVAGVSLLVAVFGFYWDVSWHIDRGRDPGPFANPAHWFIIAGLAGVALAGAVAVVLGPRHPTRTSLRVSNGWHVPVGGALLLLSGVVALAGFPLDDVWHRLFGQDVTLWGPTHIQMVGGASLSTLALWILVEEGRRAAPDELRRWVTRTRPWLIGGAALVGMSTLQGEFDFGVPQFRQLYQPVMIMLAAGLVLVAARVAGGRGAAIRAAVAFMVIRAVLALLITGLGRTTPHFPLYLPEALLVELVALRVDVRRSPRFGLAAGLAVGTLGLGAEWAWSHAWMPVPWHASLLPEAAVLGFVAAVAGAALGAMAGRALAPEAPVDRRVPRSIVAAAWAAALLVLALPLPMHVRPARAQVTLDVARVTGAQSRWVVARVRLDPPDAARDADWFDVTAWQGAGPGDGGLAIAPLREVAPGTYLTSRPFPVFGQWKALLRLESGSALEALPVYMPSDPAIQAREIPAWPSFSRRFVADHVLLQREATGDHPTLRAGAYIALGLIGLAWVVSFGLGFRRISRQREPPALPRAHRTAA